LRLIGPFVALCIQKTGIMNDLSRYTFGQASADSRNLPSFKDKGEWRCVVECRSLSANISQKVKPMRLPRRSIMSECFRDGRCWRVWRRRTDAKLDQHLLSCTQLSNSERWLGIQHYIVLGVADSLSFYLF
jgi:hypothetical protein